MGTKGWMVLLLCGLAVACCSCASDEAAGPAIEEGSPQATVEGAAPSNEAAASPRQTVERSPRPASRASSGLYSRYNLHYYNRQNENFASYANYTDCPGHAFLPYNTGFKVGPWGKGFKLVALDTGMEIFFEYRAANMAGMSEKEYLNTIMSTEPVSYDGLSAEDQEGIKTGKAMLGMTKQGVMIALGYPAKHQTPSTDLNTWVYWKGRFNMLTVDFSEDGKVGSLR